MIGEIIGHYKIIEKLGEGGMGVVYKAEDTKLKRIVALKFLSKEFTQDEEAKERFINEAQAASALDHNNICTIYEINETEDGQLYIVMAYYEGETVKGKISGGPLPIEESLDIAIQIAHGLIKAHGEGIFHRDIKPANVMITKEKVAKILDFGLAKVARSSLVTKAGMTLGTIAYMSPEQTRGEKVDHRADIWSLGVVLYEMLAGQLPFKEVYESAMVYSIMNVEPEPLTGVRTGVPMELERIVNRALSKSAEDRYQTVADLLSEIRRVKRESDTLMAPVKPVTAADVTQPAGETVKREKESLVERKSRIPKPWMAVGISALVIIAVIIGYRFFQPEQAGLQIIGTMPLTTAPGLEDIPAWSPDGTRLAYASDESGNMDIWVRQIAAGQKRNLTEDHPGFDGNPAWSPDGEWIAFTSDRNGGGIFVMPALGGVPRPVVPLPFTPSLFSIGSIPSASWSPDGTKLVYTVGTVLYTIPASGGEPVLVPLPPNRTYVAVSEPAWSPDGNFIAYTEISGIGTSVSTIWMLRPDGTDPFPLSDGTTFDHNPIWSPDGKRLFFISNRGGSPDIWWVSVDANGKPTSSPRALTAAGLGVGAIALSGDAAKLAYIKVIERSNIWSIPIIPDRVLTLDDAVQITKENHFIEYAAVSPDGDWIAFDSNRSGNADIWRMRKDGTDFRQVTTDKAHDWNPSWSPDGTRIAFHSLRSGNRDIYIKPVAGGPATQLTTDPARDWFATWSPVGEEITFESNRSGNADIWVVSSDGGKPRQLTFHEKSDDLPIWLPDGRRLVFQSNRTGQYQLFTIAAEGGKPVQLTRGIWSRIQPVSWSVDGRTIYAYALGDKLIEGYNFWAVSVEDGTARLVLDFRGSLKQPSQSLSSDGERLYFPLGERVGDLWMAELAEKK